MSKDNKFNYTPSDDDFLQLQMVLSDKGLSEEEIRNVIQFIKENRTIDEFDELDDEALDVVLDWFDYLDDMAKEASTLYEFDFKKIEEFINNNHLAQTYIEFLELTSPDSSYSNFGFILYLGKKNTSDLFNSIEDSDGLVEKLLTVKYYYNNVVDVEEANFRSECIDLRIAVILICLYHNNAATYTKGKTDKDWRFHKGENFNFLLDKFNTTGVNENVKRFVERIGLEM